MELKSKRKVKLHDLTMAQRIECEDVTIVKRFPDGSDVMLNQNAAVARYCQYGLGLSDQEELLEYSDDELTEIFFAVRGAATKGKNPTK